MRKQRPDRQVTKNEKAMWMLAILTTTTAKRNGALGLERARQTKA
jgi:hypothetical protein